VTGDLSIAALLVPAGLLVAAGLAKAVRPDGTARALRQAGLPRTAKFVRVGAVVEVAIGAAALTTGGPVPALVAGGPLAALLVSASYAGFALFVAVALRLGWALSSCGCFGEPDAPPTRIHVVADVLLMLSAAVGGAARSTGGAPRPGPAHAVLLYAISGVIAALAYLVLARLPALTEARHR
jgi:hypothetical protein